jgi:hypothetical protein
LKAIFEKAQELSAILDKTIADDDVEGETEQCDAMVAANALFLEYAARRATDAAALRDGALRIVDRHIGNLCKLQWRHISDSEEQDMAWVKTLRDVCKCCGVSELYQGTHGAVFHSCMVEPQLIPTLLVD